MNKKGYSNAALLVIALLWSSIILIGYYYVHKPLSPHQAAALTRVLIDLFAAAALSGLAGGIGRRLLPVRELEPLERFAIQAALGWGIMGIFWLGLGALKLYSLGSAWLMLALGWVIFRRDCAEWFKESRFILSLWRSTGRFGKSLALGSSVLIASQLFLALAPPVKWDTLVYHFDLPARYLQAGQFFFVENNPFWGHPQLTEMLFTWAIALRGIETAAVLSWCITAVFLAGVLGVTRHRAGSASGWLAVTALLVGLSFRGMAAWGYVDGLAALYGLGTLLLLLTPIQNSNKHWPLWVGILTGLALGVKLTAGILLPIVVLVLLLKQRETGNRILTRIALVCALALLVASPWLLKNILATGNPLYPHFFPSTWVDQSRQDFYGGSGNPLPWKTLWLPLALTWQGLEGAEGYAADIGPLLILLGLPGLLSRWKEQDGRIVGIWLLAGWLVLALGGLYSEYLGQTRLYFVLLPAAALAVGWGWQALKDIMAAGIRLRRVLGILVLLALFLSLWQDLTWLMRFNPAGVALGVYSRDQYLDDNLGWYAPATRALHELPPGAQALLLWEPRGLYAPFEAQPDAWIDRWYLDRRQFGTPEAILQAWQERGFTHLLLFDAGAEFERQRRSDYEADDWQALDDLRSQLTLLDDFGGVYSLYSLPEKP